MSESVSIVVVQNQTKGIFNNSNNTVTNEEILFTNDTNNSNMSSMINNGIQLPFNPVVLAIGIIIIILAFVKLCKGKKHNRSKILLIGQRNAGKTQLFISLNQGAAFPTVPSIKNNKVGFLLNGKQLQFWDCCGDDLSKQQCLSFLNQNQIHTIIHVVDGCDSKKITPAALFLYRVLINKAFQRSPCNYVLFFNKSDDDKNYMGLAKLTKKVEDQIQHIKQARKNEQQTENQTQEDYLKMNRSRFDIKKCEVRIVEGSAKNNIKQLRLVLEQ